MGRSGFVLRIIALFFALLGLGLLVVTTAMAEGINLRAEFDYLNSSSDITNRNTGSSTTTDYSKSEQVYDLHLSKEIFPFLTFTGGAFYDLEKATSTTEGVEIKTDATTLRPVIGIDLNNPVLKAGLRHSRTEQEEETTNLPSTKEYKDEYTALLGYRPAGLPTFNLRFNQVHTYDEPSTVDSLEKLLSLDAGYTAWKNLRFDYDYTRTDTENRIGGFDTRAQSHFGRVNYSRSFLDRHLFLNTGYRIRYNTFEFPGGANVETSVLRDTGLASLDNTPEDGPALSPVNALIDGNIIASAGVDIGLGGDETTLTNIGVDFGSEEDIVKLYIWVDRRLSASVVNSFSWSVYTSPDNTDTSTWTLVTNIAPAFFGTFQNRFELSFSSTSARFIKVTTTPLSPALPDSGNYPNIFITEIEAFTRLEGVSTENKTTTVDHNYHFNARGKVSEKTTATYNLYYRLEENDPANTESSEFLNGIGLDHIFNDMFAAKTSLSRLDRELSTNEEITEYNYAASLRANYLKTLRQTLTYSGTKENRAGGSRTENSYIIRTNATLYKGWDIFVDAIHSTDNALDGTHTESDVIRTGTNLVPNRKMTIDGYYSHTRTKKDTAANAKTSRSEWEFNVFFIPFQTLSFNFGLDVVEREDSRTTLQNYTANWSPFPDGALQFFFAYNETLRTESDQKDRTIRPSLKWQLGKHAVLDMSYSMVASETTLEEIDTNSYTVNLKLIF